MSKKSKFSKAKIFSIVTLALSILIALTFFMPMYKIDTSDSGPLGAEITVSGMDLLKASTLTDEDVLKLSAKLLAADESEKKQIYKQLMSYSINQADEASATLALLSMIAAIIIAVIGLITSIVTLLRKGAGTGTIVYGAFMLLFTIALAFFTFVAVSDLNQNTEILSVGLGVWIALISGIATLTVAIISKALTAKAKK